MVTCDPFLQAPTRRLSSHDLCSADRKHAQPGKQAVTPGMCSFTTVGVLHRAPPLFQQRVVLHPVYPHMPTRGEFTTGKSMSSPHSWAFAHASQSQPCSS